MSARERPDELLPQEISASTAALTTRLRRASSRFTQKRAPRAEAAAGRPNGPGRTPDLSLDSASTSLPSHSPLPSPGVALRTSLGQSWMRELRRANTSTCGALDAAAALAQPQPSPHRHAGGGAGGGDDVGATEGDATPPLHSGCDEDDGGGNRDDGGGSLQLALREALSRVRELEGRCGNVCAERDALRHVLDDAEAQRRQQHSTSQRHTNLSRCSEQGGSESAPHHAQVAVLQEALQEVRAALDARDGRVAALEAELAAVRGQFHGEVVVLERERQLRQELLRSQADARELRRSLEMAQKERGELKRQLRTARGRLEAKATLLSDMQRGLRELSTRHLVVVREHEAALERAQSRIASLSSSSSPGAAAAAAPHHGKMTEDGRQRREEERGEEERGDVEQLRAAIRDAAAERAELQGGLQAADRRNEAQHATIAELTSRLRDEADLVARWRARHDAVSEQLRRAEERLRSAGRWEHEYIAVAGRLGAAQAQIDRLRDELAGARRTGGSGDGGRQHGAASFTGALPPPHEALPGHSSLGRATPPSSVASCGDDAGGCASDAPSVNGSGGGSDAGGRLL